MIQVGHDERDQVGFTIEKTFDNQSVTSKIHHRQDSVFSKLLNERHD